jgi:hypothetical protein
MYSFISLAFLLTEDWRTTYVLLDANNIKRRAQINIGKYLTVNLGNVTNQTHLREVCFCLHKVQWPMVTK